MTSIVNQIRGVLAYQVSNTITMDTGAVTQLLAEYDAAVLALATACDHIEMSNLRISHCKDAAIIDAARGADHG